jgi:hypothetical protein
MKSGKEAIGMPIVRKLAPDEVQTIENKGKDYASSLKSSMTGFWMISPLGEYGEAELDADEAPDGA